MTMNDDKTAEQAQAEMAAVRRRIDALDEQLVQLLAARQRQIECAAAAKPYIGWPARIPHRVDEVLARVADAAERYNLAPDLARALWTHMIDWSIAYEQRLMGSATVLEQSDSAHCDKERAGEV